MYGPEEFIRDIMADARSHIGRSTYDQKARLVDAPATFNCFTLMQWLWCPVIELPDHILKCRKLASVDPQSMTAGDLVFVPRRRFTAENDDFGHVGIATGEDTIIHATKWRNGVVEDPRAEFLGRGCIGVRRVRLR